MAQPQMTFAQQLEKAAEQAQEQEGPEPPQRPPPKRTEGLGARAALNALRNLGPVAQFSRWSSGVAALEGPTTSASQPNLPTVAAKPPATPVPPVTRGRFNSRGRSSSSLTPRTPREEHASTPQQPQSARDQSPSLPSVRPATPIQPSPPASARKSIRRSYQMTPRDKEAPSPADGPSDSPVPRRPGPKGPPVEVVSQSAPAAPLSQTGNWREMMEVQGNAQKLLEAVFEITITEEAAISILDSYPELVWLANCLRRCPLPPGWTAMEANAGRLTYVDMGSGANSETSPLMNRFADLGRLMLHWRQNPSAEAEVVAALGAKRDQDNEDAVRARKVWKGPHKDPKTGADFWHCPATGRSTWGDPGMAAEFLARISDRLQKALPSGAAQAAAPDRGAAPAASGNSDDDNEWVQAKTPPGTPLAERRSEVREMMKELVAGVKPPASNRPKMPRPSTGGPGKSSRPASPAPPNAPRGKPTSSASEPSLGQVGEEVSEDFRARRRSASISLEREYENADDRPIVGRICPGQDLRVMGHQLQAELAAGDMTPRFHRRRVESIERLDPLNGEPSRPPSSRGPAEPEASKRDPTSAESLIAPAFEPGPSELVAPSESPATGRPLTGRRAPRPPSRSGSVGPASGEDRPRTRRGGDLAGETAEAEVMVIDSSDRQGATMSGTMGMGGTFSGTVGGFGLSNTAMEKMCAGAIQAAINTAFGETSPGQSADLDDEDAIEDEDDIDNFAEIAAIAAAEEGLKLQEEEHGGDHDMSMSLMSICIPRSPSPKKVRAPLSPHAESPSIIILSDDDEPIWTSHKPLPKPKTLVKPKTPPHSARGEKTKERRVLLGVPEPLSARGAARCDANGAPLSARGPRHHARPGNRRGSVGGA